MRSGGFGSTVVELLGAPASGKSGLATELARLPGVAVVKDHRHRDLAPLLRGVGRSWPVLLGPPPPGVSRARWAAWAGRLSAAPEIVRRLVARGADTVVLDQGPAYTLGRMVTARGTETGSAWWRARSNDCAGLLDLLVVLDADPATLTDRLRGRDKSHLAGSFDDEQAHAYLAAEQATCRLVAEILADAGTSVIHLDTARMSLSEQVSAVLTVSAGQREGRR